MTISSVPRNSTEAGTSLQDRSATHPPLRDRNVPNAKAVNRTKAPSKVAKLMGTTASNKVAPTRTIPKPRREGRLPSLSPEKLLPRRGGDSRSFWPHFFNARQIHLRAFVRA